MDNLYWIVPLLFWGYLVFGTGKYFGRDFGFSTFGALWWGVKGSLILGFVTWYFRYQYMSGFDYAIKSSSALFYGMSVFILHIVPYVLGFGWSRDKVLKNNLKCEDWFFKKERLNSHEKSN